MAYVKVTRVIFNDPATIVMWSDGTKTVVKCAEGDTFNKEIGLMYAIAKKCTGNKGNYLKLIREYID